MYKQLILIALFQFKQSYFGQLSWTKGNSTSPTVYSGLFSYFKSVLGAYRRCWWINLTESRTFEINQFGQISCILRYGACEMNGSCSFQSLLRKKWKNVYLDEHVHCLVTSYERKHHKCLAYTIVLVLLCAYLSKSVTIWFEISTRYMLYDQRWSQMTP